MRNMVWLWVIKCTIRGSYQYAKNEIVLADVLSYVQCEMKDNRLF